MFFALMALGFVIPLVMMNVNASDDDLDFPLLEDVPRDDEIDFANLEDIVDADETTEEPAAETDDASSPTPPSNEDQSTQEPLQTEVAQSSDVSATGEPPASAYELDPEEGFTIDLELEGSWSGAQELAIIAAAEYLSSIILKDIPDGVDPRTGEPIDDLLIRVTSESFVQSDSGVDHGIAYEVLGAAKIAAQRSGSYLPLVADVYVNNDLDFETFRATVLHEMLHALGFGFQAFTSKVGLGYDGLRFAGSNAISAYNSDFPAQAANDPTSDLGVPVTNEGGHWREDVFTAELMTPYQMGDNAEYLSEMTIAALEDIGYDTIWDDVTSSTDETGAHRHIPMAVSTS